MGMGGAMIRRRGPYGKKKKQGEGKSQGLEFDWKEECGGGMKTGQWRVTG